jgi:hypothetical protein
MTSGIRWLALLVVLSCFGAGAFAQALPKYRPALLGPHKRSLVNLINTERLMKEGQGDAIRCIHEVVHGTARNKAAIARTQLDRSTFDRPGSEPTRTLSVITPALLGPAYFRELAALIAGGAATPPTVAEVMRRHGLVVVPEGP